MNNKFPKLPNYPFSWRSIQVEPILLSGERITIGAIIQGVDKALVAAKLISASKLKKVYGNEFGSKISDALSICVNSAEEFYLNKSLTTEWTPPLGGFYLNNVNSSVAENIEEALMIAASYCSSFSVSLDSERVNSIKPNISAPESWRKSIIDAVRVKNVDLAHCFDKKVAITGSGVPISFGFVSHNYAAHFDAISDIKSIQHSLVRAQSKLWQLDRLRDNLDNLFPPEECELLIQTPSKLEDREADVVNEFISELEYEASRRELGIYASSSVDSAAIHLIDKAA